MKPERELLVSLEPQGGCQPRGRGSAEDLVCAAPLHLSLQASFARSRESKSAFSCTPLSLLEIENRELENESPIAQINTS